MERTITSTGMAVALAVGAVLGVFATGSVSADINGDRRVDVLDLQVLAGRGLAEAVPASDVNGDGAVDVLDLQRVLGEEGPADYPVPREQDPPEVWATLPAAPHPASMPCVTFLTALTFPGDASDPTASEAPFEEAAVAGVLARRFLGELSPHAPPLAA